MLFLINNAFSHEIEEEYHFVFIYVICTPLCSDIRELYFPEKYKNCIPSLDTFYEMMKIKKMNTIINTLYIISHVIKYFIYPHKENID